MKKEIFQKNYINQTNAIYIMCKYKQIRKIKKHTNRSCFKLYLTDIFNNLSIIQENEKVLSKSAFLGYLKLPVFLSEKIFHLFNIGKEFLTLNEFVDGMNMLYNGTLPELERIVFKILDFDGDGLIHPEDVKAILIFVMAENQNVKKSNHIVRNFFGDKESMTELEFYETVHNDNSDIFILLNYFILRNAPFSENVLNYYQVDKKQGEEVRNDEADHVNLICPTKNISEFFNLDFEEIEET